MIPSLVPKELLHIYAVPFMASETVLPARF